MTYDLNYVVLGSIFLFGYFLGSIPFGLILTKISGLGDIRKIGSGNIGATNVLRTGNKKIALFTLLLDGGKGAVAIYLITIILPKVFDNNFDMVKFYQCIVAISAVLGHCFPIWLGKPRLTFGPPYAVRAWTLAYTTQSGEPAS